MQEHVQAPGLTEVWWAGGEDMYKNLSSVSFEIFLSKRCKEPILSWSTSRSAPGRQVLNGLSLLKPVVVLMIHLA